MPEEKENILEKVVSLCKRRGFVFQGSEIYGGVAGMWDYGPLGVALKNNIKNHWWQTFVLGREDVFGLDAAIMMHPDVWEASGHTVSFSDPLVECKLCHERFRADHRDVLERHEATHATKKAEWSDPRVFNLLVEAELGAIEGEKSKIYLRGEITQGVHVNFKNIVDAMHPRIPFGVAQIGKAFRNEITPANFLFRLREFEQMELQYYVRPEEKEARDYFEYWKKQTLEWYLSLGFKKENIRSRQHEKSEMAHYARDAWDIEYNSLPHGWREMCGIHNRGNWDLARHSEYSKKNLSYYDDEKKEWFVPWVIETSGGLDRTFLFLLMDAYTEDEINGERRSYLALEASLAPVKVAVFPLLRNKAKLVQKAREVHALLKKKIPETVFDDNGNIGKRYRRQDEIGTPACVTIDFDTLENETVTVRDRNTGRQERVAIHELASRLLRGA